jgi:protein-tyrosine phosphatase
MIDFHSHVLPYIDDGAKNFDISIEMLKLAVDEETEYICATSHFIPGELEQDKKAYNEKLNNLMQLCEIREISINVLPALELYMHPDLPKLYREKKIWGINATKYLLIELPMREFPIYTEDVLYELRLQGAVPIIAHPERNFKIMKDEKLLKNLVQQGALAQINAGSLRGIYGKDIKAFAEHLVERNLVHMVGSDAHDNKSRTTKIKGAFEFIKQRNSELYEWINVNQYYIAKGKDVQVLDIRHKSKKFSFFGLFK